MEKMDFDQLEKHIIPMDNFMFKWRFTEDEYDNLPDLHLSELKPLDKGGAEFLTEFIDTCKLHSDFPFRKNFFRNNDHTRILEGNDKQISKWLYYRGLPFDKKVYLSWDGTNGMITKWKFVVKYWDSLFYGGSDDLTIFDPSLEWSLLFFHEGEIYFGTNKEYETTSDFDPDWFSQLDKNPAGNKI